jgi:hypothetical protein
MWTLVMTPLTCGRTSTLLRAATVPVTSICTGTSRFCTRTVLTLTAGPEAGAATLRSAAWVPADGVDPRVNQ